MRGRVHHVVLLLLALSFATEQALAGDGRRIALVIGNANYGTLNDLDHPAADATAVARILQQNGFELIGRKAHTDLDWRALAQEIQAFKGQLSKDVTALFYFSGHVVQIGSVNYLVPVDAKGWDIDSKDRVLFRFDDVFSVPPSREPKSKAAIIDGSFPGLLVGGQFLAIERGLAPITPDNNEIIVFPAQPNSTTTEADQVLITRLTPAARQGGAGGGGFLTFFGIGETKPTDEALGARSVFARALVTTTQETGIDLLSALRETSLKVREQTNGTQSPWIALGRDSMEAARINYLSPSEEARLALGLPPEKKREEVVMQIKQERAASIAAVATTLTSVSTTSEQQKSDAFTLLTAFNLIKTFSHPLYQAAQDERGVWQIGYGHIVNVPLNEKPDNTRLTDQQADALLAGDLVRWLTYLNDTLKSHPNEVQRAVLLSLIQDVGVLQFSNSNFFSLINQERWVEAADALGDLRRDDGISQIIRLKFDKPRRSVERALFEMKPSGTGAGTLIKSYDKIVLEADPFNGKEAIVGYDHIIPATARTTITEEQATRFLANDLNEIRSWVKQIVKAPIQDNELEAVVSFAHDVGRENFMGTTVHHALNSGDLSAAARAILFSTYKFDGTEFTTSIELERRRADEAALFLLPETWRAIDTVNEAKKTETAKATEAEAPGPSEAAPAETPSSTGIFGGLLGLSTSNPPAVDSNEEAEKKRLAAQAETGVKLSTRERLFSVSANAIRMFEGLELEAYQDVVGIWTIGYGTTGSHVKPGMTITPEQATKYLTDYVRTDAEVVGSYVTRDVEYTRMAAMLGLSYNVGRGNLQKSTIVRETNNGNYPIAADAFTMWNKARVKGQLTVLRGLARRRDTERALYLIPLEGKTANEIILAHEPFLADPKKLKDGYWIVGYGHVSKEKPASMSQDDARVLLDRDLEATRTWLKSVLKAPYPKWRLESVTVIAQVLGRERFQRNPIITYWNENREQALFAAVGYWREEAAGAGGRAVPNWDALRADAAALFAFGV